MRPVILVSVLFAATGSLAAATIASSQPFGLPANELLSQARDALDDKADVTVLLDEHRYDYRSDGSVEATYRLIYEVRTADAVSGWASVEHRWEPWHEQRPEIRARVITPDGAAHELDLKTVVDSTAGSTEPDTYSDVRLMKAPLPAVQPGSVVEQEIRQVYTPLMHADANRLYFGRTVPVRLTRLDVRYPETLPLRYSAYLLPNARIVEAREAGTVHLTVEDGPSAASENALPLLPFDAQRWPNVMFSTGDSWGSLAREYESTVEKQIAGAAIQDLVRKAAAPSGDRKATITALVHALHQQVRYTGVEFGDASIIPAKPQDTLHRKYGDCKDKAALLVSMLRGAGIPAYLALLLPGDGQDVDPKHPALGVFDHAIVYIPGTPDAWIDATADTTDFGALPSGDQGRLALIIRPETTGLTEIPDYPSSGNVSRETREFFLPDYGKAKVIETSEGVGDADASLRSLFGFAERESSAKTLRSYMQSNYVGEGEIKIAHSGRDDFSHPFSLRLEIDDARRAFSGEWETELYIPIGEIFSELPLYFRTEDPENVDPKDAKRAKDRKEAFMLPEAGVREWHYQVSLPAGEVVKKLPEDEMLSWGSATYSAHFKADHGMAYADIRFDTGKRRVSVEDAAALRAGVVAMLKKPSLELTFEPEGQTLVKAGKIREGIAVYRAMIQAHPEEPMHRVRLSSALLEAGCGQQSRAEAKNATERAPGSLIAWESLGWALANDLIGRNFEPGWDPKGTEAAYRRALAIDPKDAQSRRNLAVAFEYDAEGRRYIDHDRLAQAVEALQGFEEKELRDQGLLDNLLLDLAYLGRFQPLLQKLDSVEATPVRTGLRLAALAKTQTVQVAIEEAAKRSETESFRQSALQVASDLLVHGGDYAQAAELSAAASKGADASGQTAARANLMRSVKHLDPSALKRDTPESCARAFFVKLIMNEIDPAELLSQEALASWPEKRWKLALGAESNSMRAPMRSGNLPPAVFVDLMTTILQFHAESNTDGGARVRITSPGSNGEWVYVVPEKGQYRIISSQRSFEGIARRVLADIRNGDLPSARKWLDWVREEVKVEGGDDVLAGPVFPRVWSKSSPQETPLMRYAAATLLEQGEALEIISGAITSSTDKNAKAYAQKAFAATALEGRQWEKGAAAAKELVADYPDSDAALGILVQLYIGERNWKDAETVLLTRLKTDADNLAAMRGLSELYAHQGAFARAAERSLKIAESAQGSVMDWNQYGWFSIFAGHVTPEILQRIQKAAPANSNDAPLLHTLAAMYAEAGEAALARQTILRTMSAWNLAEPNAQCWYVFGRIAEDYGITEAAVDYYAKVDEIKNDASVIDPASTYSLAQQRVNIISGKHP